MRWNVICLIAVLGLGACSKKATLDRSGAAVRLVNAEWRMSSTSEGLWKVGSLYRDTVSKNLSVVVTLPVIDSDDTHFLLATYGVDAWVVKVLQVASSGARLELAQIYVPFYSERQGRTSHLTTKAVSFALTYAASAISERFRRFQCPAFSHDRRLDDWDIMGADTPMEFAVTPLGSFNEKLAVSELVPTALNIGNTMTGEYYVEVALFNSTQKQLYSAFQKLPEYLKVKAEKSVSIQGCSGVHQEYEPVTPGVIPSRR